MTAAATTRPSLHSRSAMLGAVVAILGSVYYVAIEAIVASAWRDPAYSYATNYISDLGNPRVEFYESSPVDSPLHALMNVSFVVQGGLFIVAALLLLRRAPLGIGIAVAILAIVHGLTTAVVGFVPEGTPLMVGALHVHSTSATATIVTGNVAAIVVGVAGARLGASRGVRAASILLGVIGLIGGSLLLVEPGGIQVDVGISERISVYSIILWETIIGAAVLLRAYRVRPQRVSAA